jgi:hypothetical protein
MTAIADAEMPLVLVRNQRLQEAAAWLRSGANGVGDALFVGPTKKERDEIDMVEQAAVAQLPSSC